MTNNRNLPASFDAFFNMLDSNNLPRFVGIDDMFSRAEKMISSMPKISGYPPCNITKVEEDQYEIQLAVAGFGPESLDVEVEDGVVKVTGKTFTGDEMTYIHRGIGMRDFVTQFPLAEYVEVVGASIENGMLTIKLERIVPDTKKAKKIPVEKASAKGKKVKAVDTKAA